MHDRNQKIKPDAKTEHVNKQGMYVTMVKYGTTEKAKECFKRPPFYMDAVNNHKSSKEDDQYE